MYRCYLSNHYSAIHDSKGYEQAVAKTTLFWREHLMETLPRAKDEALGALRAIYRSLQEGGRLIINTHNASCPFSVGDLYGDLTHETLFTKESLRSMLQMSGFQDVHLFTANLYTFADDSLVRSILKRMLLGPLTWGVQAVLRLALFSQGYTHRDVRPVLLACAVKR